MLTLYQLLVVSSLCLINSLLLAQSTKPKVYIDSKGFRYTQQQFDSIGAANRGKPIAQIDMIQKENETQITFEVLAIDPNDLFKEKWIGKALPAFSLKDIQGKTYNNTSVKGKVLVINFWSTTCGPCLKEMPLLSELVSKYAGKDILFVAPAPESVRQVQPVLSRRKFTYTVLPQGQAFFSALGIEGYPYHFIVSRTGIIEDIYTGSSTNVQTNEAELDNRLTKAIDKALENR